MARKIKSEILPPLWKILESKIGCISCSPSRGDFYFFRVQELDIRAKNQDFLRCILSPEKISKLLFRLLVKSIVAHV